MSSDNGIEDIIGVVFGAAVAIAIGLAVTLFIGIFVLPIVVLGVLYYINNIFGPRKRRRETRARVEAMQRRAEKLAPKKGQLREALIDAGVTSQRLHNIANELYKQEELYPLPQRRCFKDRYDRS